MDLSKLYLTTLISQYPQIINSNNDVISNYLDLIYDPTAGVVIVPVTTSGKIKAASGEFVNVTVDNLTVKNQYTNMWANITTANYDYYVALKGPAAPLRDASIGMWESPAWKYIDAQKPYYKMIPSTSVAFKTDQLSQMVQIILDPSGETSGYYRILMNPNPDASLDRVLTYDVSSFYNDTETRWVSLICTDWNASYGATWSVYEYGDAGAGGSGGSGGGSYATFSYVDNAVANSILPFTVGTGGLYGVATNASVNLAFGNVNGSINVIWTKLGYVDTSLNNLGIKNSNQDISINAIWTKLGYVDTSLNNLGIKNSNQDISINNIWTKLTNLDISLGLYATNASVNLAFGNVNGSINVIWTKLTNQDISLGLYATNASVNLAIGKVNSSINVIWTKLGYDDTSLNNLGIKNSNQDISINDIWTKLTNQDISLGLYATNASVNLAFGNVNGSINVIWTKLGYVDTSLNNLGIKNQYQDISINNIWTKLTNQDISLGLYATNASVNLALTAYATNASVNLALTAYATNASIALAGFAKNASFGLYATNASVNLALGAYATNASVNSAGFALKVYVDGSLLFRDNSINYIKNNYVSNASLNPTKFKWVGGLLEPSVLGSGTGSTTLAGLLDVSIVNLADEDYLKFDASRNMWINESTVDASTYLVLRSDRLFQILNIDVNTAEWDIFISYNAKIILTTDASLNIAGIGNGDSGTLVVQQDSVGSRTLTLPPTSLLNNAWTLSTDPYAIDIIAFLYDGSFYYWNKGGSYA